jgi:hypothetical protein
MGEEESEDLGNTIEQTGAESMAEAAAQIAEREAEEPSK